MKSTRQKRDEIKAKRLDRAHRRANRLPSPYPMVKGGIAVDPDRLLHDKSWQPRPSVYADRPFDCVDCGVSEVWTAEQQKWWYEEAKGKLDTRANRCRDCRFKRRVRRAQDRRIHIEGLITKIGIEATAARLKMPLDDLARMRARWDEG